MVVAVEVTAPDHPWKFQPEAGVAIKYDKCVQSTSRDVSPYPLIVP